LTLIYFSRANLADHRFADLRLDPIWRRSWPVCPGVCRFGWPILSRILPPEFAGKHTGFLGMNEVHHVTVRLDSNLLFSRQFKPTSFFRFAPRSGLAGGVGRFCPGVCRFGWPILSRILPPEFAGKHTGFLGMNEVHHVTVRLDSNLPFSRQFKPTSFFPIWPRSGLAGGVGRFALELAGFALGFADLVGRF